MEKLSSDELVLIQYALSVFRDKMKNDNPYKRTVEQIMKKISE